MSLDRKLAQWVEAGVIDAEARGRIEAFEHAKRRPVALYALAVLGGGTIALGIVSVVASNWDAIPGSLKLALDLLLGAALAAITAAAVSRRHSWASEALISLYYGFTLASLALVGQVYQLRTPTYQGLLVWSLATAPLLLLGHSRYLAVLFCAGVFTTHALSLEALFEHLERRSGHAHDLIASLVFASPLAYAALSRLPWLVRERPTYAHSLSTLAWLGVLIGGFALQFCWYEQLEASELVGGGGIAATAVIAGAFAAALPRLYPEVPRNARLTLLAIVGFGWLTLAAGCALRHPELPALGAVLQLIWLGGFARAALSLGRVRAWNTLTGLIAIRLIAIYFEVFGSLLSTGLGLITGGALTLLCAYVWRHKTRALAERLRSRSSHAD